jgi:hypothetical protein
MLIGIYLSFFDKKDLTNGVDWFIVYAMNTNEISSAIGFLCLFLVVSLVFRISRKIRPAPNTNANEIAPKTNARLSRIQKVSKCIRLFLQYGIPLTIVAFMVFEYLAVTHKITLPKPSHPSEADSIPHTGAFQLWIILSLIVYLFWYRTALKLFGLFEKGILFTAETVRCIQILGVIYCARFLVQLGFYFFAPSQDNRWLGIGLSDLFTGLLIIFIGWLIDEARKIREEQELTV